MDYDLHLQKLRPVDLENEMKKSFISYAMATIISRALPDVRDGLKPVHRRILYSMYELGVTPDKPYKKSVRIVGDVLGKYHPHGDTAVYDSLVRLAQDFSIRVPLVDGHGNFGSVDGDPAAAMRYTEARMAKASLEMLRDIDKNTVDFGPNFDESTSEPLVLPSRFPNLLVNGSDGIAVGMATNIPPHNLGEVSAAVIAMIDNPDITTEELMEHVPGPDFPTGALIMGRAGIAQAYRTGRGKVIMRARSNIEDMGHGRSRIVVTEIPYQVNKARLVEKIAELVHQKRVEGISDLREESDRQGMRIVIELKQDVNPEVILNTLYKHTQLQETFGINMLALVDNAPRILSLKQVIYYYLEHQKDVITRRTQYLLEQAEARAHILEGLLIALDFIDEVIKVIRASQTTQEARTNLCERFGLTVKQAQAILDMRLQRLTGLERIRLEEELAGLREKIADLQDILAHEERLMGTIKEELSEIVSRYNTPRKTEIQDDPADIDWDELIQREDMVVTMSRQGYIKRIAADTYRIQNRGGVGIQGAANREEDFVEHLLVTSTHDWLMAFTDRGRIYRLRCYQLPEGSRQARGTYVRNLLPLEEGERVCTLIPVAENYASQDMDGKYLFLTTRSGTVKKTALREFSNLRNVGLKAINLAEGDALVSCLLLTDEEDVLLGTHNGLGIRFAATDVRPTHRSSAGVTGIRLVGDDFVVDAVIPTDSNDLLTICENGYGKRTEASEFRTQGRGGKGLRAMNVTVKTGKLVGFKAVDDDHDILMIASNGTILRTTASGIPTIGRSTQGVRVMRLRPGEKVSTIAVVEHDENEEVTKVEISEEELLEARNAAPAEEETQENE